MWRSLLRLLLEQVRLLVLELGLELRLLLLISRSKVERLFINRRLKRLLRNGSISKEVIQRV